RRVRLRRRGRVRVVRAALSDAGQLPRRHLTEPPMRQPIVTYLLVAATVFVSWRAFGDRKLLERLVLCPPATAGMRQYDRLVTHGFIQAAGQHLMWNLIARLSVGRAIEPVWVGRIGRLGFALFSLAAIVVAIMPT